MSKKNWTRHQHAVYKAARKMYLYGLREIEALGVNGADIVNAQNFYMDAHDWCVMQALSTGHHTETVARVLAVTSPLKSWDQNKVITERALREPVAALPLTGNRKLAVLQAIHARSISPTSIKVLSFYDNIVNPHDSKAVTIDRHMARPVLGKVTVTPREYEALAEAVRSVCRSKLHPNANGHGEFCTGPSCAQALLWWWYREGRKEFVK